MRKKILFIQDHLYGGGAERITLDIADGLTSNHEVFLILLDSNNIGMDISKKIIYTPFQINSDFMKGGIKKNKLKSLPTIKKDELLKLIDNINPDLIVIGHSHAFWLSPIINHKNVWYWVHGDLLGLTFKTSYDPFKLFKSIKNLIKNKIACNYLFKNKNIITVNNDLEKQISKNIPTSNVKVISNGVNIQNIKNQTKNISSNKKWDVIFVARLSQEKNPLLALKAFALSNSIGRMAFVGSGDLLQALKQTAVELKVQDRVDFLGWKSNPYAYIKQSKLLLLTSELESYGLVISEALVLDVPVIALNVSSGVEYQLNTDDLKIGLLTDSSIINIANKIDEILENPYTISEKNKLRLSLDHTIKEFENLLL